MLIKLPIIINNKIDIINFTLNKYDKKLVVKPQIDNKDNLYQFMISNKEFCMNKFHIKFPFEITIIDNNLLFTKFFFIIAMCNGFNCELNFFSNLLNHINRIYSKNIKYVHLDYLLKNIKNIIKKCHIQIEYRKNFEDLDDMSLYIDDQLNYSLNLTYLLLYKYPNYNTKDFKMDESCNCVSKKIISSLNIVKNYKLCFKGSEETIINNHIDNITNSKIEIKSLKKDSFYFFQLNDDKVIKMKVSAVKGNEIVLEDGRILNINFCKVFNYNPRFNEQLNYEYFIKELLKYDFLFKLNIGCKLLKKDEQNTKNIINYIYTDNTNYILLSSLRNMGYMFNSLKLDYYNNPDINLELKILEDGIINKDYILYLSNKYKDNFGKKLEILKILFNKYNFPLTFNKKKLNDNFEIIIYFSFLNYKDIIKVIDKEKIYLDNAIIDIVPIKLKNLYFNLIKTYYQFKNESLENITYNFKYYQDYIYIYVIKNIIQDNSIVTKLFNYNGMYNKLVNVYKKNFILSQLIKELNWSNLSQKLSHLDYIYKNEDLVFYQQKLNKNLFLDSVDYKIKSIIMDKFTMYKYLKQEKDFVKWTKFIKHYLSDLYEKKISISNEDIVTLGKLLYKLYNISVQSLKDDKYIDLINFCQKNRKLIISENRINLMIKEKLSSIPCQLNLGFFAKHLNFSTTPKIELSENKEVKDITVKLKEVTKKYYKYKGKYMRTKTTTTSSITNFNI